MAFEFEAKLDGCHGCHVFAALQNDTFLQTGTHIVCAKVGQLYEKEK